MSMEELVQRIQQETDCRVYPGAGLPALPEPYVLPEDLRQFYELCGGAVLFEHASAPTYIMRPEDFVPANPVLVGELYEEDRSSRWFMMATDGTKSQAMTIDLDPERLGHCYDSFWDRHAVAGSSTIIAISYSEFLDRSLSAGGDAPYWDDPDFEPLGDAYD